MKTYKYVFISFFFFSPSPLPIPGKYLQFYPKFLGSGQRITFVFQEKPSKLFLSVICTSGIFKTSLCLCLSLSWQGSFIFLTEKADSHLPISLWMQFRADCHNPRSASCLQTVTGLSLPTAACTFGYKSYLKRKNGPIVKRMRDAHMLCMGALWAATWARACKTCSRCLAIPPGKHLSSARTWLWLRKLGAISLVKVDNIENC